MQGFILENVSNLYKVKVNNNIYEANARGKLKNEDVSPIVGDFVEISIIDEKSKKAIIEEIKPRKVYMKRPKIANVTQMVFVLSAKNPKPDLLMLDKQLAFAEYLGLKSIIVLNKTDLDDKEQFKEINKIYTNIEYTVVETQAKNGKGIEKLKQQLYDNVNAFSGNSGVGKSTLINGIFNVNVAQEGEISKKNKKGKNTTTSIKLYEIKENTYIADTPGFSTFDISEIERESLFLYFKEFKKYIKDCEFVGCSHIKEENCGIKRAVQEGKIAKSRYDNWISISTLLNKRRRE